MSRSPIQLDLEVKASLETFRDSQRNCSTHTDAVRELLAYFERNEKQKVIDRQNKELVEKEHQQQRDDSREHIMLNFVCLGADVKRSYLEFMSEFSLSDEASGVQVLLKHFSESESVSINTMRFLSQLS